MIVNGANLKTLGTTFKASYQGGLDVAPTDHELIAMEVPSTTGSQEYGWLGKFPSAREWVGDREIQNLRTHGYTIRNKDYELTVGVDRNDIEDDNVGLYGPMFREMGASTGSKACELVYALMKAGFVTPCYDGQNFFDTAHPVIQADGTEAQVANTDGGAGVPWFLVDAGPSRVLKPIVLQKRKDWAFTSKDNLTDDNVFHQKQFYYGSDARMNVGFGFWQMAWGSKQALNAANFGTAFAAIESMKGDHGRPLGLKPTHLIVPPGLRSTAKKLLENELDANGGSNEWRNTAELVITPWLA